MKIFGREPAALIGVVEAVLAFLLTLNVFGLTAETVGAIMAVVVAAFGLYSAYVTRDTLLGVAVGLGKAVLALFAAYGLPLSPDKTGALIALLTVGISFWQRTQTDPLHEPTFKYEPVAA